jgi:hypothetical protein
MEAVPKLKTSGQLCVALREFLNTPDKGEGLAELLQYLKNQEAGSLRAVTQWLQEQLLFGTAQPGGAHHLLLSLPIREILTTNYDLLLEDAAKPSAKTIHTVSTPNDYRNALLNGKHSDIILLGRLHGSFLDEEHIVATTDDYNKRYDKEDWSDLFTDIVLNRQFLFIGYSLRDFNVWSHYVTSLYKSRGHSWPHVMVTPHSSQHARRFWDAYNIQLVPLIASEFLIGLHSALGTLDNNNDNLLAAAAARHKLTIAAIQEHIGAQTKRFGFNDDLLTAFQCVINPESHELN